MLIDKSYFTGPITLPQLGHVAVLANLNAYIARFEDDVLQAALGYDLFNAFITGLEAGSDEDIEDKWLDLRDGVQFTAQSNIKKRWKGFANATTKQSAHAPFIYCEILRDDAVQKGGIGANVPQSENANTVSPMSLIATAWFNMQQDLYILWEFLRANQTVYTEYAFNQINYGMFGPQNQFGI